MVKLNTKHILIVHPEFDKAKEIGDNFTLAAPLYWAHPTDNIPSFVKEINSLSNSEDCALLVYECSFANELLTAAASSVKGPAVYVGNNPQPHYQSLNIKCLPEGAEFQDIFNSIVRSNYARLKPANGFVAKSQSGREVIDYSKQKVLYIEDVNTLLECTTRALVRIGFKPDNIVSARTGELANNILAGPVKFDFLITDNDTPEINFGIRLIENQRDNFKALLLCTGSEDPALKKRAEEAGAKFLAKPFGMNDLRGAISESYAQNGYIPQDKAPGR